MGHESRLHASMAASLRSRRQNGSLRSLRPTHSVSDCHDFSSNDYLDLSGSMMLRNLFEDYLKQSSRLASTGSRLLSGNNELSETIELEAKGFWQSPDALLCASGYEANVSLFSTLPQTGDVIIYDELIHASVHVGMRASRASKLKKMRHNDVHHLSQILRQEAMAFTDNNIFLAVETVYSMDGDVAPLIEILQVIRAERPQTHVILDEAHATGVFGECGQGFAQHLGVDKAPEILARLHTLGKGAAGTGALVLCDPMVKQYLLNYAKGLIYSTYMSIPALCLARASVRLLASGQNESATRRLWRNISQFEQLLNTLRPSQAIELPESLSSPIVPIITARAVELSKYLLEHGFCVMPVRYPTVPKGRERLRVCLRADIKLETMSELITLIDAWIIRHCRSSEPPASMSKI